jgi:hypothetical protein
MMLVDLDLKYHFHHVSYNVLCIHEPENLKPQRGGRDAVRFAGLSAWIHIIEMPQADRGRKARLREYGVI